MALSVVVCWPIQARVSTEHQLYNINIYISYYILYYYYRKIKVRSDDWDVDVNVAPDSILLQYPYMLPSLLSGLLSLASWLVALLLLKESNKQVLIRKGLHSPVELDDLPSSSGGTEDSVSMMESSKLDPLIKEEAVHSPVLDGASSPSSAPSSGGIWSPLRSVVTALFQGGKNKKYSHIVEEDVEEESEGADFHTPHTAVEVEPSATPNTRAGSVIVMIFKERSVMVAISLLALASLCVVTIDELFPLWAMNPPPVGLGMQRKYIKEKKKKKKIPNSPLQSSNRTRSEWHGSLGE